VIRAATVAVIAIPAVPALAGCGSDKPSPPNPDDQLRSQVALEEQALINRYSSAIAAFPNVANTLTAIRDQHVEHLKAMGAPPINQGETAIEGSKSSANELASLAAAERKASKARALSCEAAGDQELRRTLSLISCSELMHAIELAAKS